MKTKQLSMLDLLPKPKPEPAVTEAEAERVLADFVYGTQLALDAALSLLEAVRATPQGVGVVSLAEGIAQLRQVRYLPPGKLDPKNDCLIWHDFIARHPSVQFGEFLPDRNMYMRAELLLTAVHQAANGFEREARWTLGEEVE